MTAAPLNQRPSRTFRALAAAGVVAGGLLVASSIVFALAYTLTTNGSTRQDTSATNGVAVPAPKLVWGAAPAPTVHAVSGTLIDPVSGELLWSFQPYTIRPLASLTKLATVGTFLDARVSLSATYVVPKDFNEQGIAGNVEPGAPVSRLTLPTGTRVSTRDLLFTSLISSANNAAVALSTFLGPDVASQMNVYAARYGAPTARFVEPSGLNTKNVGTAHDVALLAHAAFRWSVVQQATQQPTYDLRGTGYAVHLRNTNQLLERTGYHVEAGKTGYLQEAGYNLAVQVTDGEHRLLLVLLGEPTSADRFADADALLRWAFRAYQWVPSTR